MCSKNGKGNFPIDEAWGLKVEPAFGISLIISSLSVTGRPNIILIVWVPYYFAHVARIEAAIEEDVGLSRLLKVEAVVLGNVTISLKILLLF